MTIKFEIRQQVKSVQKSWMVLLDSLDPDHEEVAREAYDSYVRDNPNEHFELVKVETTEVRVDFSTKMTAS